MLSVLSTIVLVLMAIYLMMVIGSAVMAYLMLRRISKQA